MPSLPFCTAREALLQRKRDRDQPRRTLMWCARRYIANLREILNFVMSYCSAIVYMYSTISYNRGTLASLSSYHDHEVVPAFEFQNFCVH